MLRLCCTTLALFMLSAVTLPVEAQQAALNALSPAESKAGWSLLFDGRTFSGLVPTGNADWKVEEGTLTATKGTGFLVTPAPYSNFEIKADYWIDKTANSGIFIRCGEGTPGAVTCYEVNIFDAHAEWPTGSINNTKTVLPNRPNTTEKWNTMEIRAEGNHLVVKVNGATTVDVRDERLSRGTIALQEGGGNATGVIKFRNVKVRPL